MEHVHAATANRHDMTLVTRNVSDFESSVAAIVNLGRLVISVG